MVKLSPESNVTIQLRFDALTCCVFANIIIIYKQGLIYSFGEEGMQLPIVTVQTSKFFSVTKNSNIAQVRTRACQYCLWKRVLKIVTLKNFDGCTSCMPSSPKEYISP